MEFQSWIKMESCPHEDKPLGEKETRGCFLAAKIIRLDNEAFEDQDCTYPCLCL
jgi:hypothetical protein